MDRTITLESIEFAVILMFYTYIRHLGLQHISRINSPKDATIDRGGVEKSMRSLNIATLF